MLVLRSQIGDETAFRELLELYGPQLSRFTRKMIESQETVDDLTQEIWVAIFRGLPGLREADKFRAWAFRIARDRIYREHRRRKIPVQLLDSDALAALPESAEEPALDTEELQRGLALIPPQQREVLVLRFFEEMSYEEIARVTGCALGTIRSRIHYAKEALRMHWKGN